MKRKERISTDGGSALSQNPFAALDGAQLPAGPEEPAPPAKPAPAEGKPARNRGRVDVLRQTAHRGGKTVTVIRNFQGIATTEIEALGKKLQKACGSGGTVKDRQIEIQGDKRPEVLRLLQAEGFRPVQAGG